jgi:hypothetical protein
MDFEYKVGDLVRLQAIHDTFNNCKGIVIARNESDLYVGRGFYQVQLFTGHVVIALPLELELLENEVEI